MIDLNCLASATVHSSPYIWARLHGGCLGGEAAALAATFPSDGFVLTERREGSDKTYRSYNLPLVGGGAADDGALAGLTPEWRAFVDDLTSESYRRALTSLTGIDLDGLGPQIRLCRYVAGCWLDPHTDRDDKVLTHVWYFNETWPEEWGGALRVLGSDDASDVRSIIFPALGSSTVIGVSSRSWHSVDPIAVGADDRCSVLVHFGDGGRARA